MKFIDLNIVAFFCGLSIHFKLHENWHCYDVNRFDEGVTLVIMSKNKPKKFNYVNRTRFNLRREKMYFKYFEDIFMEVLTFTGNDIAKKDKVCTFSPNYVVTLNIFIHFFTSYHLKKGLVDGISDFVLWMINFHLILLLFGRMICFSKNMVSIIFIVTCKCMSLPTIWRTYSISQNVIWNWYVKQSGDYHFCIIFCFGYNQCTFDLEYSRRMHLPILCQCW